MIQNALNKLREKTLLSLFRAFVEIYYRYGVGPVKVLVEHGATVPFPKGVSHAQ
jgi:hypothetical protein